ncbi:MAG: S41 family peptidase [Myxococcota bacterium]
MTSLLLFLACRPAPAPDKDTPPEDTGPPAAPSADWCERVTPGAAATADVPVALSDAHGTLRLFGPSGDLAPVDDALVAAVAAGADAPDLSAYTAIEGVCVLDAAAGELGPAAVTLAGDVAVVTPGTGEVVLPEGTAAVAIDLRGLPDAEGLDDALAAALAPAIAADFARPTRSVRTWNGLVDQIFSETNIYDVSVAEWTPDAIPATGDVDLPIAALTEARMPPAAAELAGALRMAGRGFVVGEDVVAAVAESRWSPVGDEGLTFRVEKLFDPAGEEWPDSIPAEVRAADPVVAVADLASWGSPGDAPAGAADRVNLQRVQPWDDVSAAPLDAAALRAALLISHGATRRFYPYFGVVGDGIDARLVETLAEADAAGTDPLAALFLLGRFGNVLSDGHVFTWSYGDSISTGCVPVAWDHLDGLPVAYHSLVEQVDAGDTLVSVDGVAIEDWYAEMLGQVGGATDGYARNIASRELWYLYGDGVTYVLRDPDGVERTETIAPGDCEALADLRFGGTARTSGWLDDLGAPDVLYVNLGSDVSTASDIDAALDEAGAAAGVIVDMRGYPAGNHYTYAERLITGPFSSPTFGVPVWQGPDEGSWEQSSYEFEGTGEVAAPIVLLVGPRTVSAAENFSTMLVGAGAVTVVGRQSAGTNGNITGVRVPGELGLSFTGMEVLYPDGSTFHGVGIVPDVEVDRTAADLRDDVDVDLAAALALLN